MATTAALQETIQNGKVIDVFQKHRGAERVVVAAPITIAGKKFYMGVMLQRDSANQRLYLHDVITEEAATNTTGDDLITTGSAEGGNDLYISNIIQKALNVKDSDLLFRLTANQYNAPALEYALEEDTLTDAQLANLTAQLRDRGIDLSEDPDAQELLEAVDMLDTIDPGFVLNITEKQYKTAAQKAAEKAAREKAAADRAERKRLAEEEKQRKAAEAEQKKAAIAERRAKAAEKKAAAEAVRADKRVNKSIADAAGANVVSVERIAGKHSVRIVNAEGIIRGLDGDARAEFTRQLDSVNEFGKAFGHRVRYFTGRITGVDGDVSGFYHNNEIYVNVDNIRAAGLKTVAHEVCHDIAAKDSSFVNSFYRLYREYCESNEMMGEFNRRWNDVYNNALYAHKQLGIAEEVLADMFGELADGDSEFLDYCLGKRPGIIARIIEALNRILTKLHLKKYSKASADAMELRNFMLGVMAEYKANQIGADTKLSSAVRSDYQSAQRKLDAIGDRYSVRGDSGVNLTEWDTTGLAAPAEYKNLRKTAPNESTSYGFKQVVVNGRLRNVLIVNPTRYVPDGYHADMVASARSLAAALGLRIGFITGETSETTGKGKNRRDTVTDVDFLLTTDNYVYINLDSEIPYTQVVAGAWWSQYRKAHPAAAANLERLAERTNALSGNNRIAQNYAVGMLTRTNTQGLKAINMDPETLIKKLSDSKSAVYAYAHENPGIMRRLFENAGDMVAKLAKKQDYRAAYISGQLQARLMKAFSESAQRADESGGDVIKMTKRKSVADGVRFMSIKSLPDGTRYVEVDTDQERFNSLSAKELQNEAKRVILEKFRNKVIGGEAKAFINRRSAEEYAYPAKYLAEDVKESKMRASTELDNLLSASELIRTELDDGHHPDAVNGWRKYLTRFKVGNHYYAGEISVRGTARGWVFHDLTKIKDITEGISRSMWNSLHTPTSDGNVFINNIPHTSDEVKFSAHRDSDTILREPTRPERRAWLDEYADTYGQIPEGEDVNSRGDQRIPRRIDSETKIRQTYRTYAESLTTPDDFVGEIEKEIVDGRASYTPLSNKAAAGYAERKLAEGMDEAMATWNAVTHGDVIADKNQIALGERLIMEAINNRDVKLFTKLVAEVAAEATRAGQMVQAISMVKRLSPEGQLVSFQKEVSKLNESIANRKGHPQITPDETLTQEYMDIASELESVRQEISELEGKPESQRTERQQDAIDSLEAQEKKLEQQLKDKKNEMITDAAEQVPPTWMEKLRAWRYFAMLGNPRTHIRNLLGNAVFIPAVRIKQGIAGGIERMTLKSGNRTQGITASKELRDFAHEDAKTQLDILASGGKYNQTDAIASKQKPFDDSKVIGKTLNKLAEINSTALEGEDAFFLRRHYEFALSRFAAANKWTVEYLKRSPEALAKARGFAYREAQRATYRDLSSFAQLMSKVSNKLSKARGFGKLGYMMFEGAMPFKKTPCNIMKRGIEYSPLGIASAISKGALMLVDKRNNVESDYSGTEFINDLAAGMTGTMIMGLGYLLTSLGMLHGRDKDEEDEINAIQGVQEYSLILDGHSYTVDWVTPVAFPLFVGSELYDQISADRDGYTMDDFYNSLAGIAEPLFSLSMMDGIQSMMQSYSSEGAVFEAGMSAAESYLGQYFPTLSGQLARTVTPEVHTAYYRDKTDALPDFASGVLQQGMAKIPGMYDDLPEKIDVWGRNVGSGKEWFQRAAENFLSPGYLNRIEVTDADRLVQDLYRETGDMAVIPGSASKYFTIDGERYDMSSDEYVAYAKTRGKTSYGILTEFYGSKEFRQLTPEQQVTCVETAYKFAIAIAKAQTNSGYVIDTKWQREAYDAFLAGETTLAQAIIDYKTK